MEEERAASSTTVSIVGRAGDDCVDRFGAVRVVCVMYLKEKEREGKRRKEWSYEGYYDHLTKSKRGKEGKGH